MLPSSCITSERTASGCNPARRIRSTPASVCPARRRTPPSRARSGKTWPGRLKSLALASGRAARRMVWARSAALMPVSIPSRASIETVKAVSRWAVFCCTIGGRAKRSATSWGSAKQTIPPV
jgi:hypothetical protein